MRKLIVSTFMTLDGVIDNPMWTFPYWSDEIAQFQSADLFASDTLLQGRKVYEGFAEAWTSRSDAFADYLNAMPKFVASRTLETANWNASILKGDVAQAIATLKQGAGKNILMYGGGDLIPLLVKEKLVDEFHILLYPLVMGTGRRLFAEGDDVKLKLLETKSFGTGVVALIYQPEPPIPNEAK